MIVHGKEVGFCLTVGASIELARMCPNHDIQQIGELFGDSYLENMESIVKFICIMSKGYKDAEWIEGRCADALTEDMVRALRPDELTMLMSEAMNSFKADSSGEIEAESKKEARGEM